MRIDIWSDVVCPWCYLGARRLRLALDEVGDDDIEVHWRAFQLDPGAPAEPQDLRATIDAKYSPGAFDSMTERLTALGDEIGIDYRFDLAQRINTADAHRLLAWAATLEPGVQNALAERLFNGYFTKGENLTDHNQLLAAVSDVGAPADIAAEVLASSTFADRIVGDQEIANEMGISGVPAFVIDQKWMVPGAQDVDTLVELLTRVRAESVEPTN